MSISQAPVDPPGELDPPGQVDGPTSVEVSYEESSTEIGGVVNWRLIILLFIWFLGLVLLAILVMQRIKSRRNKTFTDADPTNKGLEDVERQEDDNEDGNRDDMPEENNHHLSRVNNRNAILTPFLAALVAFFLSIAAQVGCGFAELSGNPLLLNIGIWSSEYEYNFGGDNNCYSNLSGSKDYADFPDNQELIKIDEALMTTMVVAVLASVLGGIALIAQVCFLASPSFPSTTVRHTAFLLVLAAISQALTLSIFSTNECEASSECLPGFGAFLSGTAIYFWALSAFGASCVHFA